MHQGATGGEARTGNSARVAEVCYVAPERRWQPPSFILDHCSFWSMFSVCSQIMWSHSHLKINRRSPGCAGEAPEV